jgi:two-component system response regulator
VSEILLIEDNSSDEKLTLFALKNCGVATDVKVLRDGAAALQYLFGQAGPPSLPALVLLDLKLPKVDGLEVLRQIRGSATTKLLPVVVLTASNEEEDVRRSYALGANAYVRKPVEFAEFAEAAKTLGLFWLSLNQPPPKPHVG